MTANGYAVRIDDKIDIRTVQHSRVGAIVNFLYLPSIGFIASAFYSDEQIERLFETIASNYPVKVEVIEVVVAENT